ncbi:hypothetical protein BXZ70DRAFT_180253 [Cristinia sonorae]|uniref:Uncharacterized protein n=1 Tax=Cristinia sonorae TaxID=1940300 RepID=A0A8K0UQ47_9AGAR|nr:hypothetical protein BXZ70DRAFT_180253 [Cristinia sonorae]
MLHQQGPSARWYSLPRRNRPHRRRTSQSPPPSNSDQTSRRSRVSEKRHIPIPCGGCQVGFSQSGLSKHLGLTENPQCIAFRDAWFAQAAQPDSDSDSNSNDSESMAPDASANPPDANPPSSPRVFGGDYFGGAEDYNDEDFLGFDEPQDDDRVYQDGFEEDGGEDEDDDNGAVPNEMPRWEPAPDPSIFDRPFSPMQEDFGLGADDDLDDSLEAGDGTGFTVHPKSVVVKFPSARAGEVVESVGERRNQYEGYEVEGDAANPYAPFTSEIDWKVAQWRNYKGLAQHHSQTC